MLGLGGGAVVNMLQNNLHFNVDADLIWTGELAEWQKSILTQNVLKKQNSSGGKEEERNTLFILGQETGLLQTKGTSASCR